MIMFNVNKAKPSTSVQADVKPKEEDDNDSKKNVADDFKNGITVKEMADKKRKCEDEFNLPNMDTLRIKKIKVGSTHRLLKELSIVHKSDYYKKGMFAVNLVDDCLYEWEIRIKEVDSDSKLMKDLKLLKNLKGKDSILLRMTFSANYPREPPFVRVMYPVMISGIVTQGGSLGLESLTKHGWTSAHNIESLIVEIISSFAESRIRQFTISHLPRVTSESANTLANNQKSFQ